MAKILFVQNHPFDLFGVETLAGYLTKACGHQCNLVISLLPRNIQKAFLKYKPDILAFPCLTGQHNWVLNTAKAIKSWNPDIPILLGGVHPTFMPDIIEYKQVDYVCRGEGEYPLRGLLDFYDGKGELASIRGISYKTERGPVHNPLADLIPDLDLLPFPDRSVYYDNYPALRDCTTKYFLSSRGCPFQCRFCCNINYSKMYRGKGNWVRQKSVDYFIAEIDDVRSKYPLKCLRINDEIFILNPDWTERFLAAYKKHVSLPFWIDATADVLNDNVIRGLKDAGCTYVSFSLETGNEQFRREMLNKQISNRKFIAAAESLKKFGLPFSVNNITGLPGETLDYALETVSMNRVMRPNSMVCSLFQPYPSAPLFDYCLEKRLIDKEDVDRFDLNWHSHSILKQPNIGLLDNLHKLFHVAVIFPRLESVIKRLLHFPSNPIFMLAQRISQFLTYKRTTRLSLLKALGIALKAQIAFIVSRSSGRE